MGLCLWCMMTKRKNWEAKGLWRRAANRWGELLKQAASDEARQYVTERRTACIRQRQP
ncbi:PerC family transcriptional regulator [Escherichia coli]